MSSRPLLITSLALLMTACNQTSDPASPSPSPATPSPQIADAPATEIPVVAKESKYLSLEDTAVDLCKHADGLMATQISWDASQLPTEGVEIWLQSPGEEKKLWAATTPKGTERTGEWLRKGSKVILINGSDKAILQEIVIAEKPCETAQ